MKKGIFVLLGLVVLALAWLLKSNAATPLKEGHRAPDFSLPDQNGTPVKLSDFRGKRSVVLAFYIKAFTPG
jgi:cytochrome oxidase Cu insertion factor (SCO1/SenC/PrrC family)